MLIPSNLHHMGPRAENQLEKNKSTNDCYLGSSISVKDGGFLNKGVYSSLNTAASVTELWEVL